MPKISVVVNTFNEEKNLPRALSSVRDLADEIIVCDMYSDDKTLEIAKKFDTKIYRHKRTDFVEPARNYAISKATGDWVLVLDADEELPGPVIKTLQETVKKDTDYVLIPRKNIIFGKWIKHSRWWPDYNIRFFKKGKVIWSSQIHSVPHAEGKELKLPAEEKNAIIHYNYNSITQYLERIGRYSGIQAKQLLDEGYKFSWRDLIKKPVSEFLSRFFAGEGYKDGIHGLTLSLLQSFSELVIYLKIWEREGFNEEEMPQVFEEIKKVTSEVDWWIVAKTQNPLKKILQKFKR
ncbi:MAG: glycosyltransferase family 2 protein [Patescibacteria group bacterium]